jgi:hypothetical protein
MLKVNQPRGVDCPVAPGRSLTSIVLTSSFAKTARSTSPMKRRRNASRRSFSSNGALRISRCNQTVARRAGTDHASDGALARSGRITSRSVGTRAFELLAGELNSLNYPDQAIFYTSGRTSNEAAFLYQLFVRQFGTNNLPDCSNMCHESSGTALSETIGVGKGNRHA